MFPGLSPYDALAGARAVGEPGVARAIGQAIDRRIAAETEILGARGADRHFSALNSSNEQVCPLWIGSSSSAGSGSAYSARSI